MNYKKLYASLPRYDRFAITRDDRRGVAGTPSLRTRLWRARREERGGLRRFVIHASAASWPHKFLYAGCFALATGFAAQLAIPLPWTRVPVTLQTFAVVASGIVLGRWWGSFSQLLYVALGVVGLPLFFGMSGGLGVLIGPRGGYLLGFILVSFVFGYLTEKVLPHFDAPHFDAPHCDAPRYAKLRSFFPLFLLFTTVYMVIMYGIGCSHLGWWLSLSKGSWPSFSSLMMMGALPFIPGDLIKLVFATLLARRVTSRVARDI